MANEAGKSVVELFNAALEAQIDSDAALMNAVRAKFLRLRPSLVPIFNGKSCMLMTQRGKLPRAITAEVDPATNLWATGDESGHVGSYCKKTVSDGN